MQLKTMEAVSVVHRSDVTGAAKRLSVARLASPR